MSNFSKTSSDIKETSKICVPNQESLSKKVLRGGMWTFLLRFLNNVLSVIRKVILARLLFPEDFGLMGIAMIAIATIETFSRTGIQAALIQKREEIESYLNTAWTFYCIRGILVFFILYFSAPLIADFFTSAQAIPVIRIIGILPLINGFKNIGILYFHKELEFNKLFKYEFSATIANMAVSISLALILHSVWALVWGGISAAAARLVMSYAIHPYRPKVRLKKDKLCELLGFGKWVSISGILVFLINQGDDIFVGKILGVATLGIYQMAFYISNMPTTEITNVIALVTYPAYSKMQEDFKRIRSSYRKVLQVTMALSMPLAGGVLILAGDFTKLFLGDKWLPILPAVQILIFAGLIRSIAGTTGPIFRSLGYPQIDTMWQFTRLVLLAVLIYPFSQRWGIQGVSLAVFISIFISTVGFFLSALKIMKANFFHFSSAIILPLIVSAAMVCTIWIAKNALVSVNIWQFALLVLLGSLSYLLILSIFDKIYKFRTMTLLMERMHFS
jgi:O-antigen/teichoic acid export membrane protein